MTAATVVRLAMAGTGADRLRVLLTAAASALATVTLLVAMTVAAIPDGGAPQYAPVILRDAARGLAVVLLVFAVPVLAFTAQCVRISSPDRDRRLAAVRLAGATPRQATLVAAAETTAAALLGSLAGLAVQLAVRAATRRPGADGLLRWPSDVPVDPVGTTLVVCGVPLLAGALSVVLLRRVVVTPLGVVRRAPAPTPRAWPALVLALGLVLLTVVRPAVDQIAGAGTWQHLVSRAPVMAALLGAATVGVIASTGWFSYTTGRLLRRYGRGPACLLAAGRLTVDPWHAARSGGALLAVLVVGSALVVLRGLEGVEAAARGVAPADVGAAVPFLDLAGLLGRVAVAVAAAGILVALVDGVVARRRPAAALVAAGVPLAVLVRSLAWQLVPLGPPAAAALALGTAVIRSFPRSVPVPVGALTVLAATTTVALLAAVGIAAVVLHTTSRTDELRIP